MTQLPMLPAAVHPPSLPQGHLFDTATDLGVSNAAAGPRSGEALGPAAPLVIYVFSEPAPQGSKDGFAIKKGGAYTGRVGMSESSKKVKPWRQDVVAAARDAIAQWQLVEAGLWQPLDCPVHVRMVFSFVRPKGHYRTGRNAHLLKDGAPAQPIGYPDLDKCARSSCDALKTAGVIKDDSRICEFLRLAKVWVDEDAEALATTGCRIEIRRLS